MPEVSEMGRKQFEAAREVAGSFGHLWAMFEGEKWQVAVELADHYNMGREDGWNSSHHPNPTASDATASNRYSWDINTNGVVELKINRPNGVAITIIGDLKSPPKIKINPAICLVRHLDCALLQLQNMWKLSYEESIEFLESAKGFSSLGIRGGELSDILRV